MQALVKSDIFFFITSIAVVVLTIVLAVAAVYVIRILRDVKDLSGKAKDEGEKIIEDMRSVRENMKGKAARLSDILTVLGVFKRGRKRTKEDSEKD